MSEDRALAAVEEPMVVEDLAPEMFRVITVSDAYRVDLEMGRCTCPDHQYREARCKHLRRAAIETGDTPVPALSFGVVDDVDEHSLPDFGDYEVVSHA